MGKQLPLTKRLEISLNACSSENEREQLFGLLYLTAKKIRKSKSAEEFYSRFATYEKFNLDSNRKTITPNEINKGKELAELLRNSVNLPRTGTPKYRNKMLGAIEFEFELLHVYKFE